MSQNKHTQGTDLPSERPDTSTGSLRGVRGSQAGDELQKALDLYFSQRYHTTDEPDNDGRKAIEAYAERLATERAIEARIDELKHMDSLTYSFMSLGNDFDYSYRQSAVDARINELRATLTGKAAS